MLIEAGRWVFRDHERGTLPCGNRVRAKPLAHDAKYDAEALRDIAEILRQRASVIASDRKAAALLDMVRDLELIAGRL